MLIDLGIFIMIATAIGGITVISGKKIQKLINSNKLKEIWSKLGLEKYKIAEMYRENNSVVLIVKVPIGGSFDEITKTKGKIEKAYGCKCTIEDVEKSKYIGVELEFKSENEFRVEEKSV